MACVNCLHVYQHVGLHYLATQQCLRVSASEAMGEIIDVEFDCLFRHDVGGNGCYTGKCTLGKAYEA